ncbi:hypothetical protein NDU88_002895 [Pleurodeles waltl]|uniref:Uncharacterized protein n=1 Tax=Pleurodeles waltl TaxID=8319 RepID=A0AAV7M3Q4_PLEWA|nr:hypothetical protein NDU88_002895 [Pleurodeles waltl]
MWKSCAWPLCHPWRRRSPRSATRAATAGSIRESTEPRQCAAVTWRRSVACGCRIFRDDSGARGQQPQARLRRLRSLNGTQR